VLLSVFGAERDRGGNVSGKALLAAVIIKINAFWKVESCCLDIVTDVPGGIALPLVCTVEESNLFLS
jgi:hypothetical protein